MTPGVAPRLSVGARVFAIIAAMSLVLAFALAALLPPTLSLARFMEMIDHARLVALQNFMQGHLSAWLWNYICVPVLTRPAWLLPTAVGLVAVGAAVTLGTRQKAPRSRRRRS